MKYAVSIIIVLIVILIVINRSYETLIDKPDGLAKYLGYWIYTSDDRLRKEVLTIEYGGDNRFLFISHSYNIRKWFPPVNPGDPSLIAPAEVWTEHSPMYRVIILSPTLLYCKSIEPTYAEIPFRIMIQENGDYIEIKNKKYISSTKLDRVNI